MSEVRSEPTTAAQDPDRIRRARVRMAHVAATCLAGDAEHRDPLTGDALPRTLSEVLATVRRNTADGRYPLPSDGLQQLVEFVLAPLAEVVERPRARIKRSHEMMPLHSVREFDAKCIEWVGRQSGRTIREKFAGKSSVLGVRRDFSPETNENILVAKLLRGLLPKLDERLRALEAGEYEAVDEASQARAEALRECERLCVRTLRHTAFAEIDHLRPVRPNNVLLGDRRYLKLWRGWRWLRALDAGEDARAAVAERGFMQAAFLQTAARISLRLADGCAEALLSVPGCSASDVLRPQVERIAATEDGRSAWAPLCALEFVLPASPKRPKAFLLIEQVENSIAVVIRAATGQGLLYAGASLERWTHDLAFELGNGKEHPEFAVKMDSKSAGVREFVGDLEGLRGISEAIAEAVLGREGAAKIAGDGSAKLRGGGRRGCGIDIGYAAPVVWVEGAAAVTGLPPYALGVSIGQQPGDANEIEWMTCGRGFAVDAFSPTASASFTCIRDAVERGEELEGHARAGLTKALGALEDDLERSHGIGAEQVLPVAIPDSVDELSQRTLRSILGSAFGRVLPCWRTSCLVLAWQQQVGFARSGVREGDGLLVLDLCSEGASVALLGARLDRALLEHAPGSGGIHWQRRPAISARELDPRSAAIARKASWREAMLRFVEHRLPFKSLAPRFSQQDAERLRATLVDAGHAERVFLDGRSVSIPLGGAGSGRALELTHDARDVAQVAEELDRDLAHAVNAFLRQDLVRACMDDIQRDRRRWHVLVAGVPSLDSDSTGPQRTARKVKSSLLDALVLAGFRSEVIVSIGMSQSLAAAGAAELLARKEAGLPAVADWLPSLWLEVVRDGGFHEYRLLKEQAVGTAELLQRFTVEESLRIPSGNREVRFPLFEGRAMRRDREVCITSPQFPLESPIEVSAAVEYRAGEAQPYRLVFAPLDGSSRVQISASIQKPTRREVLVPAVPPLRGWDDASVPEWIDRAESCGPMVRQRLNMLRERGARLDANAVHADFIPALKSLRWVVRGLCGGRAAFSTAPARVQARVRAALPLDWIEMLSAWDAASVSQMNKHIPNQYARFPLRQWSRRIAAELHGEYESQLLPSVLDELRYDARPEHIEILGKLVGDGSGDRADAIEMLVEAVRETIPNEGQRRCRSVILALADASWRHADFVFRLHATAPDVVDLYLESAKRLVAASRELAISDPERAFIALAPQCVRAIGETAIAFMRLRAASSPPAACEAGTPLLIALGIEFCSSERALEAARNPSDDTARRAGRSLRLPSYLQFDYRRNPALHQTSDLAFVLRHYLNGGSDAMIEIVGRDESEDGG